MTKRFRVTNKSGITLLEVILYLAILSTLVFGIGSFVDLVKNVRVKNQVIAEVDQQALQIIQIITQTIHNAQSISSPTLGQEQSSLVLVDLNNNFFIFALADDSITIDRGVGAVNLNNDRVLASDLLFKNLSRAGTPDIIQINFTLTYNNDLDNQIYNYSKTYVTATRIFK